MANLHMIQVAGVTYRLETERDLHHVTRIRDDRHVGTFRRSPLQIVESEIGTALLDVAKVALRTGRLEWKKRTPPPQQQRRIGMVSALVQLVFAIGPFP